MSNLTTVRALIVVALFLIPQAHAKRPALSKSPGVKALKKGLKVIKEGRFSKFKTVKVTLEDGKRLAVPQLAKKLFVNEIRADKELKRAFKKKVLFKLLTHKDERESEIKRERLESAGIVTENAVTSYLENSIVAIDDVKDKNKISRFVKSMPAKDSRTLRLHMKGIEPGIDMSWEYGCNKCGHANKFLMPITSEFFWPST